MTEQEDEETNAQKRKIHQYEALYNKYRPKRFADVVGQSDSVTVLTNMLDDRQIPHAFMFDGPAGVGKTTLARLMSASLNCEHKEPGSIEPCGDCDQCSATFTGVGIGSVTEVNCAERRGIDAMRELMDGVPMSSISTYKVYILDEVQSLTPEASSALLKTIEEPLNPQVVFILCTTDPDAMANTLRSRCTRFSLSMVGQDHLEGLAQWVLDEEHIEISKERLRSLAAEAKGSPRILFGLIELAVSGGKPEGSVRKQIATAVAEDDLASALAMIAVGKDGNRVLDYKRVLLDLVELWRDALAASTSPTAQSVASDGPVDIARERHDPDEVVRRMQVAASATRTNLSKLDARLTLESAVVRMLRPGTDEVATQLAAIRSELSALRDLVTER